MLLSVVNTCNLGLSKFLVFNPPYIEGPTSLMKISHMFINKYMGPKYPLPGLCRNTKEGIQELPDPSHYKYLYGNNLIYSGIWSENRWQ